MPDAATDPPERKNGSHELDREPTNYDRIGTNYGAIRNEDPRLASSLVDALGDAHSVVDVGAGAGSYEPHGRKTVAIEPSSVMLAQHSGLYRIQAVAESLPVGNKCFDASMAVSTIHHWTNLRCGLKEMKRVSKRQVLFVRDPDHGIKLWLLEDYVPELADWESSRHPPLSAIFDVLDVRTVTPFALPHDFAERSQHSFWRRPESYLDPDIRAPSSMFSRISPSRLVEAFARLRADLDSGQWATTHADLLEQESIDFGYRIVIAGELE